MHHLKGFIFMALAALAVLATALPQQEISSCGADRSRGCPFVQPPPKAGTTYMPAYTNYYSGCARTEAYNNPGNKNPPVLKILDLYPDTRPCLAAKVCAEIARDQGAGYLSFDLHYRISTSKWECMVWFGPNQDASYFNIVDEDVSDVYGYSNGGR